MMMYRYMYLFVLGSLVRQRGEIQVLLYRYCTVKRMMMVGYGLHTASHINEINTVWTQKRLLARV